MGNSQESSSGSKFKLFDNDNEDTSFKNIKGEVKKFCKCSYKTRLIGFGVCSIIGWTLSVMAVILYFLRHDVVVFAVMYSIGQLINLSA
jgi:hypothetical protein